MLYITIPERELFDQRTSEFLTVKGQKLKLEHSLVSISKWEAKWKKPFLSGENKTIEETRDYVRCMTITQNVDPNVYLGLTQENIREVNAYIEDPMTATKFSDEDRTGKRRGQYITSELIYSWMVAAQVPMSCETWHLNRLFVLLRVINNNNKPPKKMSKAERAAMRAKRRASSHH